MQDGPITVFAPNDDALADFAKAQGLSKVDLMGYDGLKDVILNHVAVGKFESSISAKDFDALCVAKGVEFEQLAKQAGTSGDAR